METDPTHDDDASPTVYPATAEKTPKKKTPTCCLKKHWIVLAKQRLRFSSEMNDKTETFLVQQWTHLGFLSVKGRAVIATVTDTLRRRRVAPAWRTLKKRLCAGLTKLAGRIVLMRTTSFCRRQRKQVVVFVAEEVVENAELVRFPATWDVIFWGLCSPAARG